MIITINGYQLPDIYVGSTYKQSLEDELDSLAIVYQDDTKPLYKAHDIAIVNGQKWVVGSYHSELIARIPSKKYRTTLMLVKLTKLLERFVMGPCSYTSKGDTLKGQVMKVLRQAVVLRDGETEKFILSEELETKLANTDSEEFFFNSQMTLREILDAMFAPLNYRVELLDIDDEGYYHLGFRDLNRQSENIKPLECVVNESESQDMEYLAGEYETKLSQVMATISDSDLIYEEPQTLKPVNLGVVDTTGMVLMTSRPIEKINYLGCYFKSTYFVGGQAQEYHQAIDITDLMVERELFDTMSKTEQETRIPFIRGQKNIGMLDSYKAWFFTNIKVYNYLYDKAKAKLDAYLLENEIEHGGNIQYVPSTSSIFTDVLFQIIYFCHKDIHYKQGKDNVALGNSTLISNQQEEKISLARQGESLRALANKLGNKVYEVDVNLSKIILAEETCPTCNGTGDGEIREEMCDVCDGVGHIIENEVPVLCGTCGGDGKVTYTDDCETCEGDGVITQSRPKTAEEMVDDLLKRGDRIAGDYTLLSREYSLFQTITPYIKCHYIFVQNLANVTSTKLSRERRLYKIPLIELIERDILLKDYLIVSSSDIQVNNGVLSDESAMRYFLHTFDPEDDTNDPLERLLVTSYDKNNNQIEGPYSLKFVGSSIGNSMHWFAEFVDNYSAGLSLTSKHVWGGYEVFSNPYTDQNGETARLGLRFIKSSMSEVMSLDEKLELGRQLPYVPVVFFNGSRTVYVKKDFTRNALCNIEVNKDAFEKLSVSYQLEVRPRTADFGKIIIGDALTKYANLLYGTNGTALYIWYSNNETYRINDKTCKGTLTTMKPYIYNNRSIFFVRSQNLANAKSWAIGTENGELLIAVNETEDNRINKLYFTITRNVI